MSGRSPFLTLEESIRRSRPGRIVRALGCSCGGDVESYPHPEGMQFRCLSCARTGMKLADLAPK